MISNPMIEAETTAATVQWVKACKTDDIPENAGACALVNGEQIAIYNFTRTKSWYATQNLCPHRQTMALSRGMVGDKAGEPKVACPFHKKTFSLESGKCLSGEAYEIKTYPIKVEGDDIWIGI